MIATGEGWELRLGRWQDELADTECDTIICDPPYGAHTHVMSRAFGNAREDGCSLEDIGPRYGAMSPQDVHDFVVAVSDRCRGWIVVLTSSDLIDHWQTAYRNVGRYSFAPVACVIRGMTVRLGGDGPSSWTVYAMVARPSTKEFSTWGTLPGAYVGTPSREAGGGRGKPDWLMQAIMRDYSRPGDLICDPFAGWGSTIAAATALGRRAIGAECDADAFNEAVRRLNRPAQVDLFGGAA